MWAERRISSVKTPPANIFFFFSFTNEQFINIGASGKSKQVGQPAEKKLCVAIHYVLPESGLLRLCY